MTAANSSNPDFWTVMLTLYGFIAVVLIGMWFLTRRALRRSRLRYAPPAELPDPVLASAREVAILLARERYDRGDFRRAVVRRVPSDLFTDDLVLECGHTAGASLRGEERCRWHGSMHPSSINKTSSSCLSRAAAAGGEKCQHPLRDRLRRLRQKA